RRRLVLCGTQWRSAVPRRRSSQHERQPIRGGTFSQLAFGRSSMSVVPALQRPPADTRPSTRTDIIVFGVALAVRTLFVVLQHRSGPFLGGNLPSQDAKLYLDIADRLTAGAGFVTSGPVGWKESGYPFSLGPTMWVMPGYP